MLLSALDNNTLTRMYNTGHTMILVSKPGAGKTQRITQYAKEMDLGLVTYRLATTDYADIRGICLPQKSEDGPVAVYTIPDIIRAIKATGKAKGVLFFDEVFQADHDVQKVVAPAMSERMVGDYELPPGWVVWGASNRTEDRAGVVSVLGHVANRICLVPVQADLDGWVKYSNKNNVHPMYITVAQQRPGMIFDPDPPKDPSKPSCTPRSFTYACEFHTAGTDGAMDLPYDPVTKELVAGYVGEGAASEIFTIIKLADQLPTKDEILDKPDKAKVPNIKRMDAQYAAMQLCVYHTSADTVGAFMTYMQRLNKELQVSGVKQILDKSGGALLNSSALTQFIRENKALINSTL